MTDYGMNYTDQVIDDLDKKLKTVYKEAAKDIEKKMDDFTAKSKVKEAKYQQKVNKGEMTQAEFDKWKAGQVFQGKQWQSKKEEIATVLHNSNVIASKIVNEQQFSVFATNNNFASYQMEHDAGVNFGFTLYDQNTVIQLIKDEPNLLPNYVPKKSKDMTWNTKKITRQITQGIIQGESLDKISKRLATTTASQNMNSMKTHARTLMTGAQNAGRLNSYGNAQKLGIELEKEWMATLDGHTRDSHADIDGEKQPVDHKFSNDCMYPGDPGGPPAETYNCRCTMVSDIKKYPSKYERYDNLNGKRIDNMSYKEWENEKKKSKKNAKTNKNTIKNSTTPKVHDIITLKNYDEAYDKFKAKRASQITDIAPFQEMDESLNELVNNNEFRLRFETEDSSVLKSILTNGRFKTQFETGTSGGALDTSIRKKASHNLFNTPDTASTKDYEKYGYLGSKDLLKDANPQLMRYGDGIVTFKKDQIFDRTTITVGDSLRDAADGRYIMGSKLTNIDSTVCVGRPSMIDEFNDKIKKEVKSKGIDDASAIGYSVRSYFELQYHGDLTLNDVESMTVDKFILDEIKEDEKLAEIAKKSGIKFKYMDNGTIKNYDF